MKTNHSRYRHGYTGTNIHNKWRDMMKRCYKSYASNYNLYGAKGITVCESWHTFENFLEWANNNGFTDGMSIDRVNPDLGYSPENCEVVTLFENIARSSRRSNYGRNKLIKMSDDMLAEIIERLSQGERQVDLAKEFGIHQSTISKAVKGGAK